MRSRQDNIRKKKARQTGQKSELDKLREENEYLRMGTAILKKVRALIQEEEKSGQSSRQEPSGNYGMNFLFTNCFRILECRRALSMRQ